MLKFYTQEKLAINLSRCPEWWTISSATIHHIFLSQCISSTFFKSAAPTIIFLPGKTIPKKLLEELIDQTALIPSGYNAQPWEFVVIRDRKGLGKIREIAYSQSHLKKASAIVVVLGDLEIRRNADRLLED